MSDEPAGSDAVVAALVKIIEGAASAESLQTQQLLLRRLALSGDVGPSRLPQPDNITEIGGYLNLLEKLEAEQLRDQTLASILGVAGSNLPPELFSPGPVLFFASRPNHRPALGGAEAPIPVNVRIRSDFIESLGVTLDAVAAFGASLPLLSPPATLPPVAASAPIDQLLLIGRALDVVPSTALVDPDNDLLAVARLTAEAAGSERLVARVHDESAPGAASVTEQDWTAFHRDSSGTFVESAGLHRYAEFEAQLAAAGWHRTVPIDTGNLDDAKTWGRFLNVTGLVVGETSFGDELALLYTADQIVASAVRDLTGFRWDGTTFAP